jgi:uncharacterized phiE125 gp8 family phage protein
MEIVVITPPAPVVTWAEADKHLKLDGDDSERDLVESYIAAATGTIDGPEGWLGRSLGMQTLEVLLDGFGCGAIKLPCGPIVSIESVTWIDSDGLTQTIAPEGYELLHGQLVPAFGTRWPNSLSRDGLWPARIRYQAGYDVLPAPIKAAILLMVGDLYRNRETTAPVSILGPVPMSTTVENLLGPIRRWA